MDNTTIPPTDPLEPTNADSGADPAAPDADPSPTMTSSQKKPEANKEGGQANATPDLGEFAQEQLQLEQTCYANGKGKLVTVQGWATFVKTLPVWLTVKPLKAITIDDCNRYFGELQDRQTKGELAESTIRLRKTFLRTLLQRARQEGLIDRNVCAEALSMKSKPRGGTGPREITESETLSPEQFVRVFIVAACLVPQLFFVLVAVILLTGMLGSEARALQLGDLQLDYVCKGIRRPRICVRRIEHHGTLSLAGWEERYVDVPPLLEEILRGWIATRGITDPSAWLFPGPLPRKGSKRAEQLSEVRPDWCVSRETLDAKWRKIRNRALRGSRLTLSDLRHTFCALCLRLGEDLLYVSLQVGHRALRYTRRVYHCFIEIARRHPPTPPSAQ